MSAATEAQDKGGSLLKSLVKCSNLKVRSVTSTSIFQSEPTVGEIIHLKSYELSRGLKGLLFHDPAGGGVSVIVDRNVALEAVIPRHPTAHTTAALLRLIFVAATVVNTYSGQLPIRMTYAGIVDEIRRGVLPPWAGYDYLMTYDTHNFVEVGSAITAQKWAEGFLEGINAAIDRLQKDDNVRFCMFVDGVVLVSFQKGKEPLMLVIPTRATSNELPVIIGTGFIEAVPVLAPARMSEYNGYVVKGRIDRLVSAMYSAYK